MKKYIIKYADGSEQTVMRAIHNSRKEAVKTLMNYICKDNDYLNVNNDNYLSPFDFTLEEVDVKDVNETVTDFNSARKALGLKYNKGYTIKNSVNPKHIDTLIALNELFTIAEAWDKADEFEPDFLDLNQDKWFPWFKYKKDIAGFVFAGTDYASIYTNAIIGPRLCFKSSVRAEQFGKQFVNLFNKVFL